MYDGMNSKRCHIFPQVLPTPTFPTPAGAMLGEVNIETANTMTSRIHLFNDLKEEQAGGEFTKKNFTGR